MSTSATSLAAAGMPPGQRLEVLFDELAELTGHRNAIDGRIVEIVAEIDHDGLWGNTGARSVRGLVAWKLGMSSANAGTIATIAHRLPEFPRCAAGMQEGRFSLDQIGVIANKAADGSDEHYAQLAESASVTQLRTAIKLEPRPDPQPQPQPAPEPESESRPEPPPSMTKTSDEHSATWHITLPHHEAAVFDAALQSHQDGLVAEWKRVHADGVSEHTPPFPNAVDGFMSLVQAGWDTDVAARPHGQRTTVVVHVDVETRIASLHLGPLLSDDDRRYMLCDAACEVWFERAGQVIGSGGRPGPSAADCAAPSNTATRAPAWYRAAGPPVVCTHTTSSTGRTAVSPSWPTWLWCARFIIGCIIGVASPSPVPPIASWSPTRRGARSNRDHWLGPQPHPHPTFHRAPGLPENAPTGGGTHPSNRRQQPPTDLETCGR